jgi:muramidase (phage lysozyme)
MPTEREYLEQFRLTPEGQKLLETISFAEGTRRATPEESYRVMFGGKLAPGLAQHPDTVVTGGGYSSTAAGRYQFLTPTWQGQAQRLGLSSFGPKEQDIAALALARNRLMPLGGLSVLQKEGLSPRVAAALSPEWASFPTQTGRSYYGQPVKSLGELQKVYGSATGQPVPDQQAAPVGADVTIQSFNFSDRLKNTITGQVLQGALAGGFGGAGPSMELAEALSTASDLEASDDPELQEQGALLKSKVLSQFTNSAETGLTPASLVSSVIKLKGEEQDYYKRAQKIQKTLIDIQSQQNAQGVIQNQQTAARFGQGTAQATGDSIKYMNASKPSFDASGEPGFDFTIDGGKRGAVFQSPYKAEVLKVVRDQSWENNLEKTGGGRRGYGNHVELRFTDPKTGYSFDSLIAHFDQVNPDLKPGSVISAGTPIGTQGRTGSTTGAHVSWDFFDPGSNTASQRTLQYRKQIADRISAGLPVF